MERLLVLVWGFTKSTYLGIFSVSSVLIAASKLYPGFGVRSLKAWENRRSLTVEDTFRAEVSSGWSCIEIALKDLDIVKLNQSILSEVINQKYMEKLQNVYIPRFKISYFMLDLNAKVLSNSSVKYCYFPVNWSKHQRFVYRLQPLDSLSRLPMNNKQPCLEDGFLLCLLGNLAKIHTILHFTRVFRDIVLIDLTADRGLYLHKITYKL